MLATDEVLSLDVDWIHRFASFEVKSLEIELRER
jgi:hypothetical protein